MKKSVISLLTILLAITYSMAQVQIGLGKMHSAYGIVVANGKIYSTNIENNYISITNLSNGTISSFGSLGSANGLVNLPYGIATDSNGKIYIADHNNHRIQIFDAHGNYLTKFGTSGSGDGQLFGPSAVFYGPDSRIYVGESANDRVQVFDASFNFLYSFGSIGTGDSKFNQVAAIYVDQNQIIYTVDFYNRDVQMFDGKNNGAFIRRFGVSEITASGNGITVDEQTGTIYVSNFSNIVKYDQNGNYLGAFNASTNNRQLFLDAVTRHLWIAASTGLLYEYDLAGNKLATYGSASSNSDNDISSPNGVATDSQGNIIVSTNKSGDYEIQKFSSTGTYISKFSTFVKLGLAIDESDNIYSIGNNAIVKYSPTGTVLAQKALGFSSESIARTTSGLLYFPDRTNDRITVYNADLTLNRTIGTSGTGDGQFQNPNTVALDENGNLYVTDDQSKTLQKFNSSDVFQWKVTFSNPVSSVAYSPNGFVYVVENEKIKKYDTNGNFVSSFGSAGLNLGQFYRPRYLAFSNGNLIISESSSNRVMVIPPTPEIGVSLAGGTTVTNGATIDIGNAPVGTSLIANFNVVSQGLQPLQLNGAPKIVLSGTHAADFTIDESLLPSSITGASSFKVTYAGNMAGVRTATITISTNDPDETSFSFNITATSKLEQTISNFNALPDKTYGDQSFTISASASSTLAVEFSSSNPSVATVSGNTVTIVGAGLTNITASQPGNSTYNAAIAVVRPLVVSKTNLNVAAQNLSRSFGAPNPTPVLVYSGFKNGDTENNLDTKPTAFIANSATALADAGTTHTIVTNTGSDQNYNFNYTQGVLSITKATATLQITATSATYNGTAQGVVVSTTPAGLPATVTYNTSSQSPVNAGSYDVVATINHKNYEGSATSQLVIAKVVGTIQATSGTFVYNGTVKAVSATTLPAGLKLKYEYSQNNQAVAQPIAAGTYDVTISMDDPNSENAVQTTSLVINKVVPSITLSNLSHTFDGASKAANVSVEPAGLNYSITYKKDGAVVNEQKNAGNYEVMVTVQDPNAETKNASASLIIGKADQTINFGVLSSKTFGDAEFTLNATTSSSLPVIFESGNESIAKVIGNKVQILKAGTVTLTAKQVGNENFNIAEKSQVLTIGKASQSLTFAIIENKMDTSAPFSLTASASSGLAVSFEVVSGPATVMGSMVTLTKAVGTVTIKVSQGGNVNYLSAESKEQSFTVALDVIAGIGERFIGDITLGPNPTHDVLNINLYDNKLKALIIYDVSGKVAGSFNFETSVSEYIVDVKGFTPGVYIIDMRTEQGLKIARRVLID